MDLSCFMRCDSAGVLSRGTPCPTPFVPGVLPAWRCGAAMDMVSQAALRCRGGAFWAGSCSGWTQSCAAMTAFPRVQYPTALAPPPAIVHQIVPNTGLYSPLTPIVPIVLPTASDVMERAYWHMVTARPWALHTESSEKGKRGDACVCAAGRGDASFRSWYAAGTGSPSSNEVTEADSCSLDVSSGELEP